MRSYVIFGAGFLLGMILVSGVFFISTKGNVVVYTLPEISTASVLFGGGESQISDESPSETLIDKNENQEEGIVERSGISSLDMSQPEVESSSVQAAPSSKLITELQKQVELLLDRVNTETTEPAVEEVEENGSVEVFFITPAGIKIDAEGNVIDDSTPEGGDTVQQDQAQQTEPGVFITPAGIKIDAEGNIIE